MSDIQKILDKAMPNIARRFQNELMIKSPVLTGRLRNSIKVTQTSKGLLITMVDYGCVLGAKTNITTDKGNKIISNIKKGDKVLTQDGSYQKVLKTISYPAKENPKIIEIETEYRKDKNHKLKLTQDHKVLVFKNNCFFWKEAGKLDYDDMLMTRIKNNNNPFKNVYYIQVNPSMKSFCCLETFKPVKIKKLKKFDYPQKNNGKLYDLTVENVHSYYANGILISNCFVEFGTFKQRPNPFIRNTIRNKLKEIIQQEIIKAII